MQCHQLHDFCCVTNSTNDFQPLTMFVLIFLIVLVFLIPFVLILWIVSASSHFRTNIDQYSTALGEPLPVSPPVQGVWLPFQPMDRIEVGDFVSKHSACQKPEREVLAYRQIHCRAWTGCKTASLIKSGDHQVRPRRGNRLLKQPQFTTVFYQVLQTPRTYNCSFFLIAPLIWGPCCVALVTSSHWWIWLLVQICFFVLKS